MDQENTPKKMLRCFNCGNASKDWFIDKAVRKYEGEGYDFELTVEEPHCERCGSKLYDRELEEHIRDVAHECILRCRAADFEGDTLSVIPIDGKKMRY